MYKLLKDLIKLFLYGSGIGMLIVPLWSLIQFLLNILIKIFVSFPLYLFDLLLQFTNSVIASLFTNSNDLAKAMLHCKYLTGTVFIPFIILWFYCTFAVLKGLPFAGQPFIQCLSILGISPLNWVGVLFIALGYMLFVLISWMKEFGFWGILLTLLNFAAFNSKEYLEIFTNLSVVFLIFGCLYLISKIRPLEFRSEIMEDIEADYTLKGYEKLSYYMNKKKKW